MDDNKMGEEKNNIIDLASIRFPINSKAWHPTYRLCFVVESQGNIRMVRVLKLGVPELEFQLVTVHVRELIALPENNLI
jgi:hypothetical protein